MRHEVACPNCGKVISQLLDYWWGHSEELEIDCGWCGKPVTVSRLVSVEYRAKARGAQ